jgi:membrane protease YdiL (CAAX protease family)
MNLATPPQNGGAGFLMGMIPKTSATISIAAKKPHQALWYRDRSSSEEEMTLPQKHGPSSVMSSAVVGAKQQPRPDQVALSSPTTDQMSQTDFNIPVIHTMMIGDVNLPLVITTCLSHAATLAVAGVALTFFLLFAHGNSMELFHSPLEDIAASLHWNSNSAGIHLPLTTKLVPSLLDWTITPKRLVEGVLGTFPLVAIATFCMESPATCQINFSITKAVLDLFGRRHRLQDVSSTKGDTTRSTTIATPLQVLFFSLVIATVSAVAEELIFRGLLPTAVVSYTHSVGLALLVQAMLFGLGQVRVTSPLAENGVFSIMQSVSGVWYGAMYLATGGDILPVIIAHVLYECHILVGAWKAINDQMDYTEDACRLAGADAEASGVLSKGALGMPPETIDFGRRFFYAFDHDHQGSLSLSNVKRAVAYAFSHDDSSPEPPSEDQTTAIFQQLMQKRQQESLSLEDRLSLSEFLRLLHTLKSKA